MIFNVTVGGILRFINTIGAAHSFAVGSYLLGSILAGLVIGSVWLEEVEFESNSEE